MSAPLPLAASEPPVLLREAREEDMAAVEMIYGYYVRSGLASFEEEAPDLKELLRRRAEVLGRGLPYLVAEQEDRIVGFAYAGPYRARSAYRFTVEDSIYIDQRMLRRGIGRLLLAALVERCTALGYRQMVAVIGDSANESSVGAHRAHGFTEAGRLSAVGFKLGRWVDCIIMQRPLGAGSSTNPDRR